jgi:hypothetical protein
LLASLYKSAGRAWSDADNTELLSFKRKSILTDDLNAKHPFWNSAVSKSSGDEILRLFDANQFEISAPQCPTKYSQREMVTCLILCSTKISDFQMKFFLILWTQITYQ